MAQNRKSIEELVIATCRYDQVSGTDRCRTNRCFTRSELRSRHLFEPVHAGAAVAPPLFLALLYGTLSRIDVAATEEFDY
jgi:hypothetical protein